MKPRASYWRALVVVVVIGAAGSGRAEEATLEACAETLMQATALLDKERQRADAAELKVQRLYTLLRAEAPEVWAALDGATQEWIARGQFPGR